MVKHIILWKLKETDEANAKVIKANAKRELEALMGKIDGLLDVKVIIDSLPSSNADMMLDTSFTSEETLKGYQVHPLHQAAANNFVRPYTEVRLCLDFEA